MIGYRPIRIKTAAKVRLIFDMCKLFDNYFIKMRVILLFGIDFY